MFLITVLFFRMLSGIWPMKSKDLSAKIEFDLGVKLVFTALIFSHRISFVSAATNIAAGKLVTVSSHDFVFNKPESGWCQNDAGKVTLNNNYFYVDKLTEFVGHVQSRQGPTSGQNFIVGSNDISNAKQEYKDILISWCRHHFGSGKPHSREGFSTWRPTIKKWDDACFKIFDGFHFNTFGTKPGASSDNKKKFWNPNYLDACRFEDGELVTNLLTDGSWMDEAKNSEPHRIEEVKNTCFKSKWQKYPWILVDLGTEKSVGKVKLYNRLEAQGKWKLGDYPVYPDMKKIPEVNHKPWVWDRFGEFQVFVMRSANKWRTWAKNNRYYKFKAAGSDLYKPLCTHDRDLVLEHDIPFDYWEIAKADPTAGRIGRATVDGFELNIARTQNAGFGDTNYPENLKNGEIPDYQLCGKGSAGNGVHKMEPWKKEFNEKGAHKTKAWKDFKAKNYPYVVECGGLTGRYVAVRLLNVGRTENEENKKKNFLNDAPLSLCEIQVEGA